MVLAGEVPFLGDISLRTPLSPDPPFAMDSNITWKKIGGL
jgi:hypothetical protein